jgi:hypothetical protein
LETASQANAAKNTTDPRSIVLAGEVFNFPLVTRIAVLFNH